MRDYVIELCAAAWARARTVGAPVLHLLVRLLCDVYLVLIEHPLAHVYLYGPAVHGFGFWEGQASADICAAMTHVPAQHWLRNAPECDLLIQRHVHAFVVGALCLLAGFALLQCVYWLCVRIFVVGPLLAHLRAPPAAPPAR